MTWDKLVDRCLLFTDAPGGLLKALLKEAEQELSNRLELYDSVYTLEVPKTDNGLGLFSTDSSNIVDHNYHKLPMDYLRDISVSHGGRKLRKMSDEDFYRQSNGKISGGTPTAYGISGDYIVFNSSPKAGDKFIIHYKSLLDDANKDKVLTIMHYDVAVGGNTDKIYLDTLLGSLLDGYTVAIERVKYNSSLFALGSGETTSISMPPGLPDRFYGNMYEDRDNIIASTIPKYFKGSRYTLADEPETGTAATEPEFLTGALCVVENYRNVAPVITERLHRDLCPYAIALANAKTSPDLYDKYYTAWELNMERLTNESRDRDLIYSIREEI